MLRSLIPFILVPMVQCCVDVFLRCPFGFVHGMVGIAVPWTLRPVISGFLATGGISQVQLSKIICLIFVYF